MHLVSAKRHTVGQRRAGDLGQSLVACQYRLDIEQAEARHAARMALDAIRIGHDLAEHLIATANAENTSAATDMRPQIDIPAIAPKIFQVRKSRLRAG